MAPSLPSGVNEKIVSRLCHVSDLPVPSHMQRGRQFPDTEEVQDYLASLLTRDPALFLEKYGSLLNAEDLAAFQPLRQDYEVNHWCSQLEHRSSGPASTTAPRLSAEAKNRRLAYMHQLEQDGDYFSEDSMRARAPLLWQEYIGQHEGAPSAQTAGQSLASSILRAHDELQIQERLKAEQQAEDAQLSEQEESDEDEQDTSIPAGQCQTSQLVCCNQR